MRIIYICYVILIAIPLLLLATIITALTTTFGSVVGNAKYWGYIPGKYWAKFICSILLLPVKVTGRENLDKNRSYVFVANHQGAFDIFLIYGYIHRNFRWMMKKSLRHIPLVGKACESAGHIFVDRSGPKKIKRTIAEAGERLVHGVSLVVFPEGARTFTGHMGYFKRGAFQLASDLKLDIVPLTINGSFNVLPRTGLLPKWHRMSLTIHKPIPHQGQTPKDIKSALNEAYSIVESGLVEEYKGMVINEDQEVFD